MKLLNFLFPKQCINCSKTWEYLCKECKKLLKPHMEICPYCHKFSQDYKTCLNCKSDYKNNFLEWIIIPFSYTTLLKKLILKLKYYHKKDIAWFLIDRLKIAIECNNSINMEILKNAIKESPLGGNMENEGQDLIKNNTNIFQSFNVSMFPLLLTFVPSHRRRKYFVKWYNQSEILANLLAKKMGGNVIQMMKKSKHTKSQANLNREQRKNNLNNVFKIEKNISVQWDETLIIVDDIATTGSTLNEMAKTIKSVYPKMKIRWAVLGRHN